MFSCQDCGREYANKNSLTRHSHNHRRTRQHACQICGTTFWRKDLLSRHSKMHDRDAFGDSAPSDVVSHHPEARKRVHLACEECRAAKVKCGGQIPCSTCEKSGKRCVYGSQSNRISQGPVASREVIQDQTSLPQQRKRRRFSDDMPEQNDLDSGSRSIQGTPDLSNGPDEPATEYQGRDYTAFNMLQEPNVPVTNAGWNSSANPFSTSSNQDASLLGESRTNPISFDWHDTMIGTTGWPSLHEDMFSFENPDFPWPNPDFNWPLGLSPSGIVDTNAFNSLNYPQVINGPNEVFDSGQVARTGTVNVLRGLIQSTNDREPLENRNCDESNPTSAYLTPDPVDPGFPTQVPISRASNQLRLIGELVDHSISPEVLRESRRSRATYWSLKSTKISETFVIRNPSEDEDSSHVLQHFVNLYLRYFGPLWPLLPTHNFDSNCLHPALYLTLTSIGAMYSGRREGHYATMLHEKIRKSLLSTALDLDDSETDLLWLGQARLLTQVAALYFGQKRAFSYSQYLGSILVSQARRMNLFSAQKYQNACLEDGENDQSPEERLQCWMQFEARKRLVFGIMRADSYASVLLSTRPLLSAEEINLELPCSGSIWKKTFPTAKSYIEAARIDQSTGSGRFSDIVRIALDCDEQLPHLEPVGFELLLFSLQSYVWRYSNDPELFRRLTGKDYAPPKQMDKRNIPRDLGISPPRPESTRSILESEPDHLAPGSSLTDTIDHLAVPFRKMYSLADNCDCLFSTLYKWKQSFDTARTSIHLQNFRSSLLSSLLLYETNFIRLYAPVENLHLISYHLAGKRSTPDSIIKDVISWTRSTMAEKAVRHACNLWNLIERESKRAADSPRAQFNFLAFVGLHHAAVVLWAYASNHDQLDESDDRAEHLYFGPATDPIRICGENKERMLGTFVRIYKSVSPSRWSSFATAAISLSKAQFPTPGKL